METLLFLITLFMTIILGGVALITIGGTALIIYLLIEEVRKNGTNN